MNSTESNTDDSVNLLNAVICMITVRKLLLVILLFPNLMK